MVQMKWYYIGNGAETVELHQPKPMVLKSTDRVLIEVLTIGILEIRFSLAF